MSISTVRHLPVAELNKYQAVFVTEAVTDRIEKGFSCYLEEFEIPVREPSGDIDMELLISSFHEYMTMIVDLNATLGDSW